MTNDFDVIFCDDDEDEDGALVLCLTEGAKTILESLYVGIEWIRSEDLMYDVACIDRENAMEIAADALEAGLRVGFGEIASVEMVPVHLH